MKSSSNRKKKRILLVDDEKDILTNFKVGLEGTGLLVVDVFTDPRVALSNFKEHLQSYDLLLIDIKMPKMNGFQLYQEIKKEMRKMITKDDKHDVKSKDIVDSKVCFITAYEIYYETLKAEFPTLDVGCFIKKPIELQDLVNRIKQELELQ